MLSSKYLLFYTIDLNLQASKQRSHNILENEIEWFWKLLTTSKWRLISGKSASINMEHSNCFHYLNSNDGQVHLMRFRLMGSSEAEGTG